jgi:alkylation response protein AidB-like acyl-CoA dehydrogenase
MSGNLDKRVGDFVGADQTAPRAASAPSESRRTPRSVAAPMIAFAKAHGRTDDPAIRQSLVKLHTLGEVGRLNAERVKATKAAGRDIPGMPNIGKLSMSNVVRLQRDLGLEIAGARGMLHAYNNEDQQVLDAVINEPALALVTRGALYAQAPPIYGGTDQIQRNIIGERVLGLPKEPGGDSRKPFSELPKNA